MQADPNSVVGPRLRVREGRSCMSIYGAWVQSYDCRKAGEFPVS